MQIWRVATRLQRNHQLRNGNAQRPERLAQEVGVEIRYDSEVTGLRAEKDLSGPNRVTGVDLDNESIEVDYVVNAAGARGGRIAAMAGMEISISRNGETAFSSNWKNQSPTIGHSSSI